MSSICTAAVNATEPKITGKDVVFEQQTNPNVCLFSIHDIPFAVIHKEWDNKVAYLNTHLLDYNVINIADFKAQGDITIKCVHFIGLSKLISPVGGKFICDASKTFNEFMTEHTESTDCIVKCLGKPRKIDIIESVRTSLIVCFRDAIARQDKQQLLESLVTLRMRVGEAGPYADCDNTNNILAFKSVDLKAKREVGKSFVKLTPQQYLAVNASEQHLQHNSIVNSYGLILPSNTHHNLPMTSSITTSTSNNSLSKTKS